LLEGKQRGVVALGWINVVGSSIARETDAGVYLRVGPKRVAPPKAFLGQMMVERAVWRRSSPAAIPLG